MLFANAFQKAGIVSAEEADQAILYLNDRQEAIRLERQALSEQELDDRGIKAP